MADQNHLPQHHENSSETSKCKHMFGFSNDVFSAMKNNLALRSKWTSELNGAIGDLGTYIPIVLALTLAKDLNLGTTLIFTGIYNLVTGVVYGVPMPVQPMKSIAAVAISDADFGIPEIMAAGICTGAILFLLGVTGLMGLVYKLIPLPVVRGIQLSQGLSFALTAIKYVRNVQNFSKGKASGKRHWMGLDGLLLALVCACFIVVVSGAGEEHEDVNNGDGEVVVTTSPRRGRKIWKILVSLPSAMIVFVLGVVLAIIRNSGVLKELEFGPSSIHVMKISRHAWKEGFIKGTIPQLPLSVLNSVIAVCKLSADLFPGKDFSSTSVSISVGMMNMVGCWFGAMPTCHGAGGLAGQYKFGGRSGACVAILGAAKLVLGVVLGSSLVSLLSQFPVGLLGILLLFAGIELAMTSRDMKSKEESFVMLVCTTVSLVGSSAALGFLCGMDTQQAPHTRDRDQVPANSRVSVRERLGPRGATSKAISRNLQHKPQPSIHLGREVQSDISRGLRPSKRQEEEQRPQPQIPVRECLSESICTHNPKPARQATQAIHQYVTQEHMNQRIKELIEAQALGSKDNFTKLQGSLIAKELFDMKVPTGFHTLKIRKYKGTDPKEHIQQF
ncbi:hypothetical protein GIB67_035449 [Kingdonia uniflora]|uniref:Molybdate transporter 1 n=1 Tax=Kingdonia uniflora TaxID=39325 RepID=A0A7J7P0C9_9MAGN|nr:hypothetical protein GIB67_035449 [Kingdonia uniflora]